MPVKEKESVDDAARGHHLGRRWLRVGLAVLAAAFVLFYAVAGYFGSADMFGDHPRWRGMNRGPSDFGLISETVSFDSTDGIPLKAWWLPAYKPRGTVIIAHGIDHTRQVMLPRAAFLVRAGYGVLLLDLRGHGESGGTVVSPGLLEARDIQGALRYLRLHREQKPVVLMGVSYGAVASLIAASESPEVAAVISDGAFTSGKCVSEDISRHFARDPHTGWGLRSLFFLSSFPGVSSATAVVYYLRSGIFLGPDLVSVIPFARGIAVPTLVISGERDWIVPTARARDVLSAIPHKHKEFVIIPNAVHDTTYSAAPSLYATRVLRFLENYSDTHK
jgi:pimeloyl-ACP methyl ester carboxylesterase